MSQTKIEIEDSTDDEDIQIEIEDSTDDEDVQIEIEEENYEDPLSYDLSSIQESSTSSTLTDELKKLGEDIFKGEKYKRYQEAVKENVPVIFIVMIDNQLVNLQKIFVASRDIIYNYNKFLEKGIKLSPSDTILLFYIVNKNKSKQYLIDNFNKFHEVAGEEEYFLSNFSSYKARFDNRINFMLENVKKDFTELENFYSKIEKFKTTDKYENVLDTFGVNTTKSTFLIKDDEYFFDEDNMKIIFDKLESNSFFSYIRLDTDDYITYYKIFTGGDRKYENFIEYNANVLFEKKKMYLFYELSQKNRNFINYIKIDFETSKCEINYYENTLDFILKKVEEIIPEIVFSEKEDTDLSGDFEITIDDFKETKLYYLTVFNDIFSEFIYIREDSSLRSLKENIKYYYVGSDQMRENLNYSAFFYIKKLYNNRYLIKYTSKSTSATMIKEFILIMIKLFWYYNNIPKNGITDLSIIEEPYTGVNGQGLGGDPNDMTDLLVSNKTRKIENLQKADPDLFQKRLYVRTCPCQQQPIIIAKEDREDWENYKVDGKTRNVVLFPPKNSKQKVAKNYYVCTDDKFKNFSLRENPDASSLYPLIPCCNVSNFPQDLYDDYDQIRENPSKYWASKEKHRGKSTITLKTLKILTAGRKGILMDYVVKFLSNVEKNDYIREGARKNSKSSFVHCILKGLNNYDFSAAGELNEKFSEFYKDSLEIIKKYNTETEEKKELAVSVLRNLLTKLDDIADLSVCMQELYDYSTFEILQLLKNPQLNLDSDRFFRFFEVFYSINIFVFVYDKEKDTTFLETPNYQYYHIRIVNENLPSLFLVKHKRKYSYDVYEIIRRKDGPDPYLFNKRFSKYMKQYIFDNTIYYIKDDNILRKNCFNNLSWDIILKDYKIIHQNINSSGRMFSFTFQASEKENDLITIFTQSSPPLFCKQSDEVYSTSKKRCISLFGEKYKIGSMGLWYPINDIEKGFFIPCKDVKEKEDHLCKNFEIILGKNFKNRELENIDICKTNSNIYLQLIKWLYLLEKKDLYKWLEKNVIVDSKMNPDALIHQKFALPMRFPTTIITTKEGIDYLGNYIPEIFDKKSNKIYMYPKLYSTTLQNLLNFLKANDGLDIPNMKTLKGLLVHEKDFKKYPFNKVLTGSSFNYWGDNILKENQNIEEIDDDYINYKVPFILKNGTTDKIYMVQNTEDNTLTISLVLGKIYKMFKNSSDYKINLKNVWKLIKAYYKAYNFGWTLDKLRTYINSKIEREIYFKDENQCFDFLIKNKIAFQLEDKFSYIVYAKMNEKLIITRKYIIDEEIPLEVYGFSNGAYASMLPII